MNDPVFSQEFLDSLPPLPKEPKPRDHRPIITISLTVLTGLVFLVQVLTEQFHGVDLPVAYGAKFGPPILFGQYWRLITPIFLHGSIMHLLSNMYSLVILGVQLEPAWGHDNFLIYYLICGFAGNTFSYLFSPETVSVGASSSIFGLISGVAMLILLNRRFFPNWRNALVRISSVILINFSIGLSGNIDNWAHLGGFLAGILLSYLAGPKYQWFRDDANHRIVILDKRTTRQRIVAYVVVILILSVSLFIFHQTIIRQIRVIH